MNGIPGCHALYRLNSFRSQSMSMTPLSLSPRSAMNVTEGVDLVQCGGGVVQLFLPLAPCQHSSQCQPFPPAAIPALLAKTPPGVMGLYNGQELVDFKANSSEKTQ